jgi:hypothetical protein
MRQMNNGVERAGNVPSEESFPTRGIGKRGTHAHCLISSTYDARTLRPFGSQCVM